MLLSFNDICLVPAVISNIEHRSECSPYLDNRMLPLFTAPMSSIINQDNWEIFKDNKINTIIPRSVDFDIRRELSHETFVAVSLSEFEYLIDEVFENVAPAYICVDIANGHMKKLLDLCRQAKERFGDRIQLMAGNIANPDTYYEYAEVGIDYVRVGIGTSPVCLTSANNGIHYPMVSLLQEINARKDQVRWSINSDGKEVPKYKFDWTGEKETHKTPFKSIPKIVADGGFNNFDQIIKALAIGADYVMLGKIFAKTVEACGDIINKNYFRYDVETQGPFQDWIRKQDMSIIKFWDCHREYYGMSTKRAQKEFGNETFKTAEGIETLIPVEYTLAGWCDNFISYLRSAMSYCNARTLIELKKNARIEQISANAFQAYYK